MPLRSRLIVCAFVTLIAAACEDDDGPGPDASSPGDAPSDVGGPEAAIPTDMNPVETGPAGDTLYPQVCETPGGSSGTHGSVLPEGQTCCTCNATGAAPPALTCAPRVTTVKCNYMGTMYDDGAEFMAADGCNRCKCNVSGCMPGNVGCTQIRCPADAGGDGAGGG